MHSRKSTTARVAMLAVLVAALVAGQTRTPQSGDGQWSIRTATDGMTGQSRLRAAMIANADSNGRHGNFEVTATCTARILAFTITYHSAFDQNLSFQQTQGASMVILYDGIGTGG